MAKAVLLSLLAGLATGVGGAGPLLLRKHMARLAGPALGFAAGMMLAVSAISLVPEAVREAGPFTAGLGFLTGVLVLLVLDELVPHLHVTLQAEHGGGRLLASGILTALGIFLHNFPEGFAVASGYAASESLGILVALSIGAHNIPEGLVTALPLLAAGVGPRKVFLITLLSGLSEPVGALIGFLLFRGSGGLAVALSMAGAAGAMVYITADEPLPEAHKQAHSHLVVLSFAAAFWLAVVLEAVL